MDPIFNGAQFHRRRSSRGQSLVEYALVLAFISVLSICVMGAMGEQIRGLYLTIINALSAALPNA
jgi:Flp pilus assembly pilin Flp